MPPTLPVCLSICLPPSLPVSLSMTRCVCVCVCVCVFTWLSSVSGRPTPSLPPCLSVHLPICHSLCVCVYLCVCPPPPPPPPGAGDIGTDIWIELVAGLLTRRIPLLGMGVGTWVFSRAPQGCTACCCCHIMGPAVCTRCVGTPVASNGKSDPRSLIWV